MITSKNHVIKYIGNILKTDNKNHGKAVFDMDNDRILIYDNHDEFIAHMNLDYIPKEYDKSEYCVSVYNIVFYWQEYKLTHAEAERLYRYALRNNLSVDKTSLCNKSLKYICHQSKMYSDYLLKKIAAFKFKGKTTIGKALPKKIKQFVRSANREPIK